MPDLFHNLASGTITDNPLAIGATSINSDGFANLPVVVAPDTLRLTIDPDGTNGLPEIVLVTAHAGGATVCTVTRGQETANGGNAAHAHIVGTVWSHSATRADWEELPYRKLTTTGDMLYASAANTTARLAKGTTGLPIVAGASVPAYAALDIGGVSAALLEILCPAGTIRPTINGTADTGWALFGTTLVDAQSASPVLWGKAPAAWKSGADLVLPSMTDKGLDGFGATALGASGGANTHTLTQAELPAVTITIDPPNTTVAVTDPGHTHPLPVVTGGASGTQVNNSGGLVGNGGFNTLSSATGISASVNIAPFQSGNLGSGTAMSLRNAHLAVVYQIKVH